MLLKSHNSPSKAIELQAPPDHRLDELRQWLAARLSGVRTLSYIANRGDWLHNPVHWQGTTRQLEDRLSDTLHEKLMPGSSTGAPAC